MLSVYDEETYGIGRYHVIEENEHYSIIDETSGSTKEIKGTTLLKNLREAKNNGMNNYKNVILNGGSKFVYRDLPMQIPQIPKISVDLFNGVVNNTTMGLQAIIQAKNKDANAIIGEIIINNGTRIIYDIERYSVLSGVSYANGYMIKIPGTSCQVRIEPDYTLHETLIYNVKHDNKSDSYEIKFRISSVEMNADRSQKFKINRKR